MKRKGKCRLCGKDKELTFEHVPPKAAFNSSPVYFQDKDNLLNKSSYQYGGRKRSNNGAGGYHLCTSCNNKTGSWYANDYVEFAKMGTFVMTRQVYANHFICAEYEIRPLNVLKQILTMFVALESSNKLIKTPQLREYLLDRNNNNYPTNIRVLMYMTSSIQLRNALLSSNMDGYMRTFGEVSYTPFGFHISIDSPTINRPFCDITFFSKFYFNEEATVKLPLRYLIPRGLLPGMYI